MLQSRSRVIVGCKHERTCYCLFLTAIEITADFQNYILLVPLASARVRLNKTKNNITDMENL